jgi:hypothetical protein
MLVYFIILILLLIYLTDCLHKPLIKIILQKEQVEQFSNYPVPNFPIPFQVSEWYNLRGNKYVPLVDLPPGYNEANYLSQKGYPVTGSNEYCQKNPTCYPCPNWKHIGPPSCPP